MTSIMSRRRPLAVAAAGALLAAGSAYAVMQAAPAFAATSANVWLTTPDQQNRLTPQQPVPFGSGGSGPVITVDADTTYQTMVGFGASLTDSAAWNIYNSPNRNSIMTSLFSPTSGIGLSWLRQPLGATDFSRSFYSYDDGSADPSLSRFSISHDQSYILPLVTQAKSLNPAMSAMVVPWSAPAWMKTNNNLVGGSLSTNYERTFADYLVKSVQAYQAAGVPVQYLAVQNEPQNQPGGYPGMLMAADQESRVINTLAPKLSAAGLGTKILGWDHNWDNPGYAESVLAQTGNNTVGTAWHCYGGDPSAQSQVKSDYPNKDIFFTECSGTSSGNTFADSLLWQGRNLAVGATRNWARSVSLWNMALDNNHGPVIGSCTNCMGVVTVDGGGVTYNADYYVLGHLAKFVKPGAVRINSTAQGQGGIENVAFRNPDGSIVLVAVNSGGTQNFQVSYGGSSFGYSMPGGSMATFTWPGSGGTTPPPGGIDSSK
ncbi:glycoside hydrolase family 30 beta sandwich domain-containing protein [Kutzneria buriramensis]|uniref:Glucosylceramidase n=1 Tax=Kutzneria buriramensis TaxID=1045776 RepID=A0A3E0G5X6_9PSEU|nr:glycoside hydrolase family 30 beta sandwich domain-containing protein [Kutzneria buriramensis]REH17461.1 glucosylceramidase [Kutzneria buriramensis]